MAALDLPFAALATRRAPTADELANGYGCGDADLQLFDFLAWWLSGQIDGVITGAGLVTDDADLQQLLKAIQIIAKIDPTASTVKAPKLTGILATSLAGGTSVPNTTTTTVNYGTIKKNNLGTSTWNGNTLTVGSGEAGLWLVSASVEYGAGAGSSYVALGLTTTTGTGAYSAASSGTGGDGQAVAVPGVVPLAVGDTVKAQTFHQLGGTASTLARDTSQFSAFLISAY